MQPFHETSTPVANGYANVNPYWIYDGPQTRHSTLGRWTYIVIKNCYYLAGHNLVLEPQEIKGACIPVGTRITSKGIDFLVDDGGLSSILNIVTVKLHSDTVKEILAAKIDQSDLSFEEKQYHKSSLLTIRDAALTKITEMVVEKAPWAAILAAIQTVAGMGK